MVVRFFAAANPEALIEYTEDLKRIYSAANDKPVAIAVVVGHLKFPDPAARAAMKALSVESKRMVASTHLVIEGTGAWATMMRTIIDGLALVMGFGRGAMVFHSSADLAIRGACAAANVPADPIVLDWNTRSRQARAG